MRTFPPLPSHKLSQQSEFPVGYRHNVFPPKCVAIVKATVFPCYDVLCQSQFLFFPPKTILSRSLPKYFVCDLIYYRLHDFPRFSQVTRLPALFQVTRFPALFTGYIFLRPFHWLHVCRAFHMLHTFPRFSRVTRFPALFTGYTFSRAFHMLHVFPRFSRVTRFPRFPTLVILCLPQVICFSLFYLYFPSGAGFLL